MSGFRNGAYKAGLEALYFSGAHVVLRPLFGGRGAILMLHHVRPAERRRFAPNRLLEITPDYLERVIQRLRARRFDIVSMDEVERRLLSGEKGRPFVAFTFDDGYRDNAEFAYPILKRHEIPFTVYIPTSFPDHRGELWWLVLEQTIRSQRAVAALIDGRIVHFDCSTNAAKSEAFAEIYWWLRSRPEEELRAFVRDLSARHGIDFRDICKRFCMSWRELDELAHDPLVTIGAHTVNHTILSKTTPEAARNEVVQSKRVLEAQFAKPVRHFAYPIGDRSSAGPREFELVREAGFSTGVTTRPGLLFRAHGSHLTALPRLSLNGHFQSVRYLDVLLSGAPFAVYNGFRRVNAA